MIKRRGPNNTWYKIVTKKVKILGLGENEAGEGIEWPLAISGIVTTERGKGVVGK